MRLSLFVRSECLDSYISMVEQKVGILVVQEWLSSIAGGRGEMLLDFLDVVSFSVKGSSFSLGSLQITWLT